MTHEYIAGSLDNIGYVAIETKYNGKWVLCYHSERQSWECPGGHVELNETALEAAKRELYEETGAMDFTLIPVWDFEALNNDGSIHNNGRTYYAIIMQFGNLPEESEMERIGFFESLPENVTYDRNEMNETLVRAENIHKRILSKSFVGAKS